MTQARLINVFGVVLKIELLESGAYKVMNIKTGATKEYRDSNISYGFWHSLYYSSGYEVSC